MKKSSLIITSILILLLLTACVPSNNNYDSSPDQISEYVTTAPSVTHDMNSADYWIEKCSDADTILMETDQITNINKDNEPTFDLGNNKEIKLSEIGDTIPGDSVTALLSTFEKPDNPKAYFIDGKPTTESFWNELIENMDIESINSNVSVKFAFSTERINVKAAPDPNFIGETQNDLHYDMNAVAECAPYEPVAVLHESQDSKWYYILCYGYSGWVPKESIAICGSRDEWIEYQNPDEFLIVTDREIRLAYDPYDPESSGLLLPMGTKLTLISPDEAPADFNGRASYNSYIVKVPGRDNSGYITDIYSLIPVSEDVSIGYLPYTHANIINQAFKKLGDRYGWAGSYYSNDCSGITKEIYSCFGFKFPRNGKAQIRMTSMQSIDVSKNTDSEKIEILSELPAGSLLYFPGHLMIYLGMDHDTPYVISAVGSMATKDMPKGDSIAVNSVILNSLSDTTRKTGKTWLSCITNILTCENL